jgi:hypothetical protein
LDHTYPLHRRNRPADGGTADALGRRCAYFLPQPFRCLPCGLPRLRRAQLRDAPPAGKKHGGGEGSRYSRNPARPSETEQSPHDQRNVGRTKSSSGVPATTGRDTRKARQHPLTTSLRFLRIIVPAPAPSSPSVPPGPAARTIGSGAPKVAYFLRRLHNPGPSGGQGLRRAQLRKLRQQPKTTGPLTRRRLLGPGRPSPQRWRPLRVAGGLFEAVGDLEQLEILAVVHDQLQPHGQAAVVEPGRDRDGREAGRGD